MTTPANDNRASEIETRSMVLFNRRRIAERAQHSEEYLALASRIANRQSIGGSGPVVPANDNQAWPLAKALLAEKNYDLLLVAVRYRQLEWAATTGHRLMGVSPTADLSVVHESDNNDDGSISYGRVRRSQSANAVATAPGRKARPTSSDGGEPALFRTTAVPRKWTGDDKLHAMIDAKRVLSKVRDALGALAEPLEAMVVEGETYEQVGRRFGVGNRAGAMGFARGVAHLGLLTARGALSGYTQIDANSPMDGKTIAAMAAEWASGEDVTYRHELPAAA